MRRVCLTLLAVIALAVAVAGPVAHDARPAAAQTSGGVCAERDNLGICVRYTDGDPGGGVRNGSGYAPIGQPVCGRNSSLGDCTREFTPDGTCFRWVSVTTGAAGQWRLVREPLQLCGDVAAPGTVDIEDMIIPGHRTVVLSPRGSASAEGVTGLPTELAMRAAGPGGVGEQIERPFNGGVVGVRLAGDATQASQALACGTTENGAPVKVGNNGFEWTVAKVQVDAVGTIVGHSPAGTTVGAAHTIAKYEPFGGDAATVWQLPFEEKGAYVIGLTTCWEGYGTMPDPAGGAPVPFVIADGRFAVGQFVLVTLDDGTESPVYRVREIRSENN